MARKKNKSRSNRNEGIKLATNKTVTEPVTVVIDVPDDAAQLSPDSGTASPAVIKKIQWKDELVKAWMHYQACMLERYHWSLDQKRKIIATEFSDKISQSCLLLDGKKLAKKIVELQSSAVEELTRLNEEEERANETFRENLKRLENGESMSSLPSVNPCITMDHVTEFIEKYSKPVAKTNSRAYNNSEFSYSSEDSGIVAQNACLDTALPEPDVSSDMKFPYLSNIWKPDRVDCLDSSFATSGICTDRSSTFDPFTDTNLFAFPQPSSFSQQSNIAYDDAAILQAVVAGGDLPPQNESETAISCNSSFFSNLIPPSMCKNMEGELTSAFQNTVLQPNINTSTSADMNVNSLEERLTPIVTTPNVAVQNVGLDESREKDSQITRSGPSAESVPVEFTDGRNIGVTEQELIGQLSFGWKETDNVTEQVVPQVVEYDKEPTTAKVQKSLSFASVVSSQPKQCTPVQSAKSKTAVYSTKERKLPKSSSLNKTDLCWEFMDKKACPWGDECIFAHGEKELRPLPKWFEKYNTPVKTAPKKSNPPHPEPCDNHYCFWRIQHLRKKTVICKLWQSGRCSNIKAQCSYAHGQSDLKPLPKLEMCRPNMKGKCNLKASECVYAHTKSELKVSTKKKAKKKPKTAAISKDEGTPTIPNRLRTISEASNCSNDSEFSFTSPCQVERVRTVSETSIQSNHSNSSLILRELEEFDWKAWGSQQEVPAEEDMNDDWNQDECTICALEFSEEHPRFPLECEHDTFHAKCIGKWIMSKDQSCPICRHPTNLSEENFQVCLPHYDDEAAIMIHE